MLVLNQFYAAYQSFYAAPAGTALSVSAGYIALDAKLGTINGGNTATITTQIGFNCLDLTVGGTNYGFRGQVATGSNKWNLYMDGTAPNYMAGGLQVDGTVTAGVTFFNAGWGGGNVAYFGTASVITGFGVQMTNTDAVLILDVSTGAIGTASVTLCPTPFNFQRVNIAATGTITVFTLATGAGTTTSNPPVTFTTRRGLEFVYVASRTTWFGIS